MVRIERKYNEVIEVMAPDATDRVLVRISEQSLIGGLEKFVERSMEIQQ